MAQTDFSQRMFRCAAEAAKIVTPDTFRETKSSWGDHPVLPALRIWRRQAWVMAIWGESQLVLCSNGSLWMVSGLIAFKVSAPADVLARIFAVHQREAYWLAVGESA